MSGSVTFRYDEVDLEVDMGVIRPDAVTWGREGTLTVETIE